MAAKRGSIRCLRGLAILTVASLLFAREASVESVPDIVLRASLSAERHQTYIELPFDVPSGVVRLTVAFEYSGKDERTTLDLGIADPQRFRGWSGGNKDSFTLSDSDATPSYLPGAIIAGQWRLLLGVPNIRPKSVSSLEAKIYFTRQSRGPGGFTDQPLENRARWYRGDLHLHTGHSDGRCSSQTGKEIPCPVFVTLLAAAHRELDFVAITDHNTTSHFETMRESQPYFDRLLLIPGREITTFQGHVNVLGVTEFLDFRVGSQSMPQMNTLLESARRLGALLSINHPSLPTGEACMGCGWQPRSHVDMNLVGAIEVVNGGIPDGSFSGLGFWEQELHDGLRLTAIGGSDNHKPELALDKTGSVGNPTTVVYAPELSVPAILEAIKSGHVFVDLTGSSNRLLEFSASSNGNSAAAGDSLQAPPGASVQVVAHIVGCSGSSVVFLVDGRPDLTLLPIQISQSDARLSRSWTSDGMKHMIRVEVRSADGRLQLLGNPIYLNHENSVSNRWALP